MQIPRSLIALAVLAALSACDRNTGAKDGDTPKPEASATSAPGEEEPVSILRPEIEQPELPELALEPLNVTIGFPGGGDALDAAALLGVQEVLASDQLARGGPIVLRGHSDAGGSDTVNQRASRARAERVAEWLVENDVAEDRLKIIAFGEQNPVEPNALPDGTPNEAGRALNRRVEVLIVPAQERADQTEKASEAE
jgi:OOP family OmpA-OmpF porin